MQPWCALGSALDCHDGRNARRKRADEDEREEARLENDQMGNQTTSCFFWPWIGISIGDGDSPELLHKRPPDFRTLPPHELRLLASSPLLATALVILGRTLTNLSPYTLQYKSNLVPPFAGTRSNGLGYRFFNRVRDDMTKRVLPNLTGADFTG